MATIRGNHSACKIPTVIFVPSKVKVQEEDNDSTLISTLTEKKHCSDTTGTGTQKLKLSTDRRSNIHPSTAYSTQESKVNAAADRHCIPREVSFTSSIHSRTIRTRYQARDARIEKMQTDAMERDIIKDAIRAIFNEDPELVEIALSEITHEDREV